MMSIPLLPDTPDPADDRNLPSAVKTDRAQQPPRKGSVLGFDFGERRIGVAQGEHLIGIAHPLTTIDSEINNERFRRIGELIEEWQPVTLVVGLPLSLDGTEHQLTHLCKRFARRLEGRFRLPVVMIDERLSSAEASQSLKEQGIGGRRQKPVIDQVAAQHILQSYFDGLGT
jgi:putative Holliday junction resolvase